MNSWALWAGIGACGAIGIREWVEYYLRIGEKRRNCYHDFRTRDETEYMGYVTRHCHKCGTQEHVPKKDSSNE